MNARSVLLHNFPDFCGSGNLVQRGQLENLSEERPPKAEETHSGGRPCAQVELAANRRNSVETSSRMGTSGRFPKRLKGHEELAVTHSCVVAESLTTLS